MADAVESSALAGDTPGRRVRQPGQELMGAAARVCADQHAALQVAGHLRQCQAGHLDVIGGRVRSRVPWAEHDGQRLAGTLLPWSANTVRGWKPSLN
jgi:hypothetical protein